jgi:pSer/pThr/pTyr-binding forkhead associated (FHA) protein
MFLTVIKGIKSGTVYSLNKSDITVIGRGEECDIRILDLLISRRHCQIRWKDNDFYIKDNNSTNKTFLNKKIISGEEKLEPGDIISVGNTILLFTDKEETSIKKFEDYQKMRMSKTRQQILINETFFQDKP